MLISDAGLKVLLIFGSSSELTEAILDRAAEMGYREIHCFGRRAPSSKISDNSVFFHNVELGTVDLRELQLIFSEINARCDWFGFLYLPSYQVGRRKLEHTDTADVKKIIEITLLAPIYVVQLLLRVFSCKGSIVLVSSQAAKFGGNQIATYAAAKGGIESLVRGLSKEIAAKGLRINAISPSLLNTESLRKFTPPDDIKPLISSVPLGRLATPCEFANLFFFLAGDQSSYITGAVFDLTGGR